MKNTNRFLLVLSVSAITIFCAGACSSGSENPYEHITGVDHIRWGTIFSPLEMVTISWRSAGGRDLFSWGYTPSLEKGILNAELKNDLLGGNIQEYTFDKVDASSTIYYAIYDSENYAWTDTATFRTAPDPLSNQFSFTAGGDSRTDLEAWQMVSKAIEREDFALFLGDLVNNGNNKNDWDDWYTYGQDFISNNLVFYVMGNHDEGNIFQNNLVNPGNGKYYAFEYGNAIFVGLEDQDNTSEVEQAAFIDSVFMSNTDKTWRFVFFHKPFYTSGHHTGEMDHLLDSWWTLFDQYGVDMIFNGHEHNYLRTKPINRNISDTSAVAEYGSGPARGRCQVIAGSYGAPRRPAHEGWFVEVSFDRYTYTKTEVNGNELIFKAYDAETGEQFDEMILNK
jgi:hypothetical protein